MRHLLGYGLAALVGAASATGVMFAVGAGSNDGQAANAAPTATTSPTKPAELTVSGTFRVDAATASMTDDGPCWTDGGYDDIESGTQVVIRDAHGSTMAIGELGAATRDGLDCAFPFVVTEVPGGKGIYRIEVSHRGELEYTEAQIRTHLELGLD